MLLHKRFPVDDKCVLLTAAAKEAEEEAKREADAKKGKKVEVEEVDIVLELPAPGKTMKDALLKIKVRQLSLSVCAVPKLSIF